MCLLLASSSSQLHFTYIHIPFFKTDAAATRTFCSKGKHVCSDQHLLYGWSVQVSYHCRHDQPHCRGLTSLPQNKSWHHRWADTAPLTRLCRHGAGPSLPPLRSCDICALGSCWFAYRAREDSPPPPPPSTPICRKTLRLSLLLSSSAVLMLMLMEAQIILPLSLPSPLRLSRPLLLTHQRQCTAYSLPAATMETGVVVYDSERPVCREMDRKGDTQRQGKKDKEQDLLTRSVHQWLHVDGIKSASSEGTVSCICYSDVSSLMLVS